MAVLENISSSKDVKQLNIEQLNTLAIETRERILSVVNKNGGHLASNLGIVEMTIALHRVFDFSKDRLIFDVGHQCYAHKILSGRNKEFDEIRKENGISGFPDREESEYDAFGTGHAGTSISAGLGYCLARDKMEEDYFVVNVVGDGALANGLNLEALMADASKPKRLIVILNDNGMSISVNENGFYKLLSKGTTRGSYIKSKRAIKKVFGDSFITKGLSKVKGFIKRLISKNHTIESYGFKYVGVVDGNNIKELVKILGRVKNLSKEKAVFLHVKTTKGKGFEKAEAQADLYHGVGARFSHESGSFSLALGEKLNELIEKDDKIVAITAGMADGTGLVAVKNEHPNNFIDVGIAEEFAVTYASGMSAGGLKPVVALYSTFTQRCYDQIFHDVCLQNLPVVFCLDRAGLVGSDGKTHQGVFDFSFLSHLPNLKIFAPSCEDELKMMLEYALSLNCPVVIRYPKSAELQREVTPINDRLWERVKDGNNVTILAVGPRMLKLANDYAEGKANVGVINARTVKPLCEKTLLEIKDTTVLTLEENSLIGGFGSMVRCFYADRGIENKTLCLGVKDRYISHSSVNAQLKENNLTVDGIDDILKNN